VEVSGHLNTVAVLLGDLGERDVVPLDRNLIVPTELLWVAEWFWLHWRETVCLYGELNPHFLAISGCQSVICNA